MAICKISLHLYRTNRQTYTTMDTQATILHQRNFINRRQDDFNGIQDLCRYCDLSKIEEMAIELKRCPQDLFFAAGICPCCVNEQSNEY